LSSSATIASTPTAPYIRPEQPSHSPGSNELVPASQAPPIALDGFCPVTLIETMANNPTDRGAWRKGDLRCGAIHRGRTYLFASATEQQKFLAHPDTFAPVMSGFDVVRYAERGELVEGRRSFGLVTPEGRIYLFADEESLIKFNRSPANYAAAAELALRGN
jgi:YHS domain-containing protein